MPDRLEMPLQDMHSEAWWIRVMEDDLTEAERLQWETHLQQCDRCREELAMLTRADDFLVAAPEPPRLPPEFATVTVQKIRHKQQWRRYLSFFAGTVVIIASALVTLGVLESALSSFGQGIGAIISARQVLFYSLLQTFMVLFGHWRSALPFIIGASFLAYGLMMPNGLLMTFAIVWLSGRRRLRAASSA